MGPSWGTGICTHVIQCLESALPSALTLMRAMGTRFPKNVPSVIILANDEIVGEILDDELGAVDQASGRVEIAQENDDHVDGEAKAMKKKTVRCQWFHGASRRERPQQAFRFPSRWPCPMKNRCAHVCLYWQTLQEKSQWPRR